ncbi:phosphodiesterase [Sedimentitalea sp. CY04]|uniref:Phosphodiesterase n=1 Tax=Parasedimentitalea denitrificans TaxID=2211118 RepID=A0ABX0W655_9RHOB|nr:glycerophosphodiester phosphodiesterase family protein [Sedimentitalea sp. CY04]NIZ61057.1 phosphodiesterase [Sedimentitalea sp. CY04]
MTLALPSEFLGLPIAHRALHDVTDGRPENSRAAIRAAIDAGYGIEIDLQLSADGHAMVFHDYHLERLANGTGSINQLTRKQAQAISLKGGDGEGIPDLAEVLKLVDGQVPLLIEIKDQDGQLGPDIGLLERATADALMGYRGSVALMSFNPNSTAEMVRLAPDLPCGIVTSAYDFAEWPELTEPICDRLRDIPDFDRTGACFISHEAGDLSRSRVQELRDRGVPVLCWTINSLAEERAARVFADNVTFEGYLSPLPG